MGQHYTKTKEDYNKEKTMNATEFMERMVSLKRIPDQVRKVDKIENTK